MMCDLIPVLTQHPGARNLVGIRNVSDGSCYKKRRSEECEDFR